MDINVNELYQAVAGWMSEHGLPIFFILVFATLFYFFGMMFLERIVRRLVPAKHFHTAEAEKKREDTLIRIARGTLNILVWLVAILMVLSEAGVNIGPLLAAAGVAGLAVGFGGQYLIRDVVAGLFIIVENQYRVGDVVCLDSTCGLVENISVRMTTMRDLDGTVHHVPHGTISKTSNLSKEFSSVNLDVGVSYSADLEKVITVVNEVGREMAEDVAWKADILKPIHFERVDAFGDSAVVIKILGDTKPLRQWAVAGEYRKRLKIAFDRNGIEIPFPQRVIHYAEKS